MNDVARKSAQEVEIDHLLAEEFLCDPSFASRFLKACGLPGGGYQTRAAIAEPSLGGEGFGDLLVQGEMAGTRVAILIEDKITAGPSARQAQRYSAYASIMRDQGWDQVWTVMVAPAAYRGERVLYDASVDLETVAELLQASDPLRLAHRRGIITRALHKRVNTGVKIPDHALRRLKTSYLDFVDLWCRKEDFGLQFPPCRESYYDGDSWIEPVRHPSLPGHVHLRHRLWTSVKLERGQIDLIVTRADDVERAWFTDAPPEGATATPYSNGKGVQVSLRLPEMRQTAGLNSEIADEACRKMRALVEWYQQGTAP